MTSALRQPPERPAGPGTARSPRNGPQPPERPTGPAVRGRPSGGGRPGAAVRRQDERLRVELGSRSYDVLVGPRLIARAGREIAPLMRRRQAIIVSDENVARRYLAPLSASLAESGIEEGAVILPPGEETKDLAHFGRLVEEILGFGIERGTMLLALGGGVVGDITGFAAASLLRGIDFVQIPTTLLAQVDSSVGGKTAINTRCGKNLLGAFYQPRLVLADSDALKTLPRRELLSGYAEIVKYGLIGARRFFSWLEKEGEEVLSLAPLPLRRAVLTSCRMKAAIVAADEREAGERALLNLGHTFAHALEAETGFGERLLHGEAVALGICLAFDFAALLGIAPREEAQRVRRHLGTVGLPTELSAVGLKGMADRLLAHMRLDKKVEGGRIALVLPRRIGQAFLMKEAPADELRDFLAAAP